MHEWILEYSVPDFARLVTRCDPSVRPQAHIRDMTVKWSVGCLRLIQSMLYTGQLEPCSLPDNIENRWGLEYLTELLTFSHSFDLMDWLSHFSEFINACVGHYALGAVAMLESQETYNGFLQWMRQIGRDCGVRDSVLLACCVYSKQRWGVDPRPSFGWLNGLMNAIPLLPTHSLLISVDQDDVTLMSPRLDLAWPGRASGSMNAVPAYCLVCRCHEPRLRNLQFPQFPHQSCFHSGGATMLVTKGVCKSCTANLSSTMIAQSVLGPI
jgi:hypothetical protein